MSDSISRQAAIDTLKNAEVSFSVQSTIDFTEHRREVQEIVDGVIAAQTKAIEQLPPAPERVGHWIEKREHVYLNDGTCKEWTNFYCSECDAPNDVPSNFCPNCGAHMIEEVDE